VERRKPADWRYVYRCECGEEARGQAAARRHAKQGHKTQRDAYAAGELHTLTLERVSET